MGERHLRGVRVFWLGLFLAAGLCAVLVGAAVEAGSNGIAGIHFPMPVTSSVDVADGHWLTLTYRVLLGRPADDAGYRVNFGDLQAGRLSRQGLFYALVASHEFQSNPQLQNATGFIERAYKWWLRRAPAEAETASWASKLVTNPADQSATPDRPIIWALFQRELFDAAEYHADGAICPTGYYTLGGRVRNDSLLLADLFAGRARMGHYNESEPLNLAIPTAHAIWDQKMPVNANPDCWLDGDDHDACVRFFALTRSYRGNRLFTISLVTSNDAVNFDEMDVLFKGQPNTPQIGATYYDAHVAIDYTVCPPRYVAAMECIGHGGAASLCVSFSTTPTFAASWTSPAIVVDGCAGGHPAACGTVAAESASTGVTLFDADGSHYLAWTQVYDGLGADDPLHHTYSQMAGPFNPSTTTAEIAGYFGTVMSDAVRTMLPSEAHPWCNSSWDCNNRDKQDWKREGDMYYVLYNGANFYRCSGAWGISAARSSAAVADGAYSDRLPLSRGIAALVDGTCGASYPMLNVIDGELWVYYAYVIPDGRPGGLHVTMRTRLVATPDE